MAAVAPEDAELTTDLGPYERVRFHEARAAGLTRLEAARFAYGTGTLHVLRRRNHRPHRHLRDSAGTRLAVKWPVMGRKEGVMPKEYVYGNDRAVPDTPDVDGPPVVVVGWSRELGDVQIVTRLRECELFFDKDNADAPIPCQYGMYVDLDRTGTNDLIRHLRRARDQAFGRDE